MMNDYLLVMLATPLIGYICERVHYVWTLDEPITAESVPGFILCLNKNSSNPDTREVK